MAKYIFPGTSPLKNTHTQVNCRKIKCTYFSVELGDGSYAAHPGFDYDLVSDLL